MAIGPIPFDMLMRPVKYVEGGGIIVNALEDAFFVNVGSKLNAQKIELKSVYGEAAGNAVSYHNNVFLIAADVRDDEGQYHSVMFRSTDKIKWTEGGSPPSDGDRTNSAALVWSGGKFHQSYVVSNDIGAHEFERSSVDGSSWTDVVDYGQVGTETNEGYRSPFPGKYCQHHDCKDMWDQNVPDGFMHVRGAMSLRPVAPPPLSYSNGSFFFGDTDFIEHHRSSKIEAVAVDGTKKTIDVVGLEYVFCVAAVGGIWIAGGGGGLAVSQDSGKTWKVDTLGREHLTVFNILAPS